MLGFLGTAMAATALLGRVEICELLVWEGVVSPASYRRFDVHTDTLRVNLVFDVLNPMGVALHKTAECWIMESSHEAWTREGAGPHQGHPFVWRFSIGREEMDNEALEALHESIVKRGGYEALYARHQEAQEAFRALRSLPEPE